MINTEKSKCRGNNPDTCQSYKKDGTAEMKKVCVDCHNLYRIRKRVDVERPSFWGSDIQFLIDLIDKQHKFVQICTGLTDEELMLVEHVGEMKLQLRTWCNICNLNDQNATRDLCDICPTKRLTDLEV